METSPPAMNDTMRQAVDLMLQNTKHGSMANIEHIIEMQTDKIAELEKMLANAKVSAYDATCQHQSNW